MKTINPSDVSSLPDSAKTGEAYMAILIAGEEAPQVRLARMYFTPGSRTAWHSHAGGEYLHIQEGTALMQERDGDIVVLNAGDTLFTEPNVEHWHGAPANSFTIQLAIWGAPVVSEDEAETGWGPQVSDEEAGLSDKGEKDNEDKEDNNKKAP